MPDVKSKAEADNAGMVRFKVDVFVPRALVDTIMEEDECTEKFALLRLRYLTDKAIARFTRRLHIVYKHPDHPHKKLKAPNAMIVPHQPRRIIE